MQGVDHLDLTDNELAKSHIRYMIGGRSSDVSNERLYRLWFPERPGALTQFLVTMGERWNISLFHYRNQGSDFGRVLIGLEVPPPWMMLLLVLFCLSLDIILEKRQIILLISCSCKILFVCLLKNPDLLMQFGGF